MDKKENKIFYQYVSDKFTIIFEKNSPRFLMKIFHYGELITAPVELPYAFWTKKNYKGDIINTFIDLGIWGKEGARTLMENLAIELHEAYELERSEKIKEEPPKELTHAEEDRAKTLLNHPKLIKIILDDMDRLIAGEAHNKALLFLIYCSAYMEEKVHPRLTGGSSGGKTYLMFNISNYIPKEDIMIKATRMTGHSLEYNLEGKNLNGKIIIISEFEGTQDAIISLRPLMSGDIGGLNLLTVRKTPEGNIVGKELKCEGIPLICTASTALKVDFEFENRTWKMEIDESKEQTEEIIKFLANRELYEKEHQSKLQEDIKNSIRYLKKYGNSKIKIIFANKLAEIMPKDSMRMRRDFSKILSFIKISAWMHQFQRPTIYINDVPFILATLDDYDIATQLYTPSAILTMKGWSKRAIKIHELLKIIAPDGKYVKMDDIIKRSDYNEKLCRMALNELFYDNLIFKKKDEQDYRRYMYALDSSQEIWKIGKDLVSSAIFLNKEDEEGYRDIFQRMEIGKLVYRQGSADSSSNNNSEYIVKEMLSDNPEFVTTVLCQTYTLTHPFQIDISPISKEEALSTENIEEKTLESDIFQISRNEEVNMEEVNRLPNKDEIKSKIYELNIFNWIEIQMEFEPRCHTTKDSKILEDTIKTVIKEMKASNMLIEAEENYFRVVQ